MKFQAVQSKTEMTNFSNRNSKTIRNEKVNVIKIFSVNARLLPVYTHKHFYVSQHTVYCRRQKFRKHLLEKQLSRVMHYVTKPNAFNMLNCYETNNVTIATWTNRVISGQKETSSLTAS